MTGESYAAKRSLILNVTGYREGVTGYREGVVPPAEIAYLEADNLRLGEHQLQLKHMELFRLGAVIREREALKLLNGDPHVIGYRGQRFYVADGKLFSEIAIEYFKSENSADMLSGGIDVADVGRIIADSATALKHCALEGIIHRDVKPENILYQKKDVPGHGTAKVIDFGIAQRRKGVIFQEGFPTEWSRLVKDLDRPKETIIGTLMYLSPEQVRVEQLTPAINIFQLGLVAYELLTGKGAFSGSNDAERVIADVQWYNQNALQQLLNTVRNRGFSDENLLNALYRALEPTPQRRQLEPLKTEAENLAQGKRASIVIQCAAAPAEHTPSLLPGRASEAPEVSHFDVV